MNKKIEQIRLIHKAFEDEKNHVASYVPENPYADVKEVLETVFSKTQNLDESWNEKAKVEIATHFLSAGKFTMCPGTDTRSTSVGDLMVVCYENPTGNGYKEVWYKVADAGFEKWFDKQHIANDHLKEKYKKGGTA